MSAFERIASWFNETREEEDEEPRQVNNNRKNSMGTGIAIGTAVAAGVFTAWGISKLLSDNTDTQERVRDPHSREPQVRNLINVLCESSNQRSSIRIRSPSPEIFKMNTDATCHPEQGGNGAPQRGPSGYGGILRDRNGNWVQGFIGYIDDADIFTAELHGVYKGLQFFENPKYKGAIYKLETDSEQVYNRVTGKTSPGQTETNSDSKIVQKCEAILYKNESVTIKHIPRNANKCADKLANIAMEKKLEYLEIERPPPALEDLVEEDRSNFKLNIP